MSTVNFSDWPVISTDEFDAIIVDAVKCENGQYGAMINFVKSFAETEADNNQGMSIFSGICGDSLEELFEKIDTLIEIGFFGELEVDAIGTLYNEEWQEIEQIDWNALDVDYVENGPKPYLH